ncbi:MAG: hypothetical protein WBV73_11615 [Phormidium sp.]
MSHISPMNTLTETINLPLVVATLTSVGLHSLFWFYQPVVPMADKATAAASDRPSVRVVQLTPEEILRLPQYAQQTQPTLPNLPQGQIPTNLLPNLPEAKSEITLPPPPSFPIYNPNPSIPSPTPESKTSTSGRRNRTTVPKSPQASARNNQTSQNQKPETNEKLTLDQLNLGVQSQTEERTNSQSPRTNQSQKNSQTSGGEFMRVFEQYLAEQNNGTSPQNPQIPETETQNQGNQNSEQTTGTLLDRQPLLPGLAWGTNNNQNLNRNQENTNNRRNNRNQVDQEARLKAVYGYNAANTTIPQGIANYRQWLDEKIKNKKYAGKLNTERQPISDKIRSPFEVKLPDVTPAGIAVLVDPEGKIVGEPGLTRSTGYSQLNKMAIEQVKKRAFPETGKYEVYHYLIEVDQKDLPKNVSESP